MPRMDLNGASAVVTGGASGIGEGVARQLADRVVFMADGETVEVVTPEHFFTDPAEERTRLFLSQIL